VVIVTPLLVNAIESTRNRKLNTYNDRQDQNREQPRETLMAAKLDPTGTKNVIHMVYDDYDDVKSHLV
jgi:hypothetical protein